MVTADIEGVVDGAVTVSANEGVSAVVDGGVPETLVLEPQGGVRLLSSARTPVRHSIPPPPQEDARLEAARGLDPLLNAPQIADLRKLAAEVRARIPPKAEGVPWDIEFGLVGNKAFLMQIRPLKISKTPAANPFLQAVDAQAGVPATKVDMSEAIE